MKTKAELEALKNRCEKVTAEMRELSDDELDEVVGGLELSGWLDFLKKIGKKMKNVTEPVLTSDLKEHDEQILKG